jgi:hypothetical protein
VLHTCELMSGKLTSVMKVIHLRLVVQAFRGVVRSGGLLSILSKSVCVATRKTVSYSRAE